MSLLEGYRLFTGHYIYESDIPSEDKLTLIRFLKEADADDIIDILSGQYGVEGLSEGDMELVNDILEGKFSTGAKAVGKGASWAGGKLKVGATNAAGKVWTGTKWVKGKTVAGVKGAGRGIKRASGWEAVAKQKALKKSGVGEPARYKKALRTAIARTAAVPAAGGVAGGGYVGYKKSKG